MSGGNVAAWILRAATDNAIPPAHPGIPTPSGGSINDLNAAVRGSVQNGSFAESRPPEQTAYSTNGKAVTWGEIAERERHIFDLCVSWVEQNSPELIRKYNRRNGPPEEPPNKSTAKPVW